MKTKYESPVFLIDTFEFNSSIAKCGISINSPLTIYKGDCLCPVGDNGHKFGGQSGTKGVIMKDHPGTEQVTLFNDGAAAACQYDWAGPGTNIAQTNASFAESFYGNEAGTGNHAPAYNGQTFLS